MVAALKYCDAFGDPKRATGKPSPFSAGLIDVTAGANPPRTIVPPLLCPPIVTGALPPKNEITLLMKLKHVITSWSPRLPAGTGPLVGGSHPNCNEKNDDMR